MNNKIRIRAREFFVQDHRHCLSTFFPRILNLVLWTSSFDTGHGYMNETQGRCCTDDDFSQNKLKNLQWSHAEEDNPTVDFDIFWKTIYLVTLFLRSS